MRIVFAEKKGEAFAMSEILTLCHKKMTSVCVYNKFEVLICPKLTVFLVLSNQAKKFISN